MIREMTGITRTQLNTASRTLTVRSTEQNVALAQALLRQIEQPHGELILEIEILELNRNTARQLGVTPPSASTLFTLTTSDIQKLKAAQQNGAGSLLSVVQSIFGSSALGTSSVIPPLIAFGGGKSIFLATVPGASADFSQALSTVRHAQRILLRAQDGKPATFFVGDRFPVSLGLLSANSGSASAAVAQALLAGLSLPRADYTVGAAPVAVALGDFNGDGHPDMVVANHGDGTTNGSISILLGSSAGSFGTQTQITIPGTLHSTPSAVAVGDFDGDKNLDIAVTDSANNTVVILFGDGTGKFAAPIIASTLLAGSKPMALLVTDLNLATFPNGDKVPDLAIVNQGNGTVSVLLTNAAGSRTSTFGAAKNYPVGLSPTAIATANFNADTFPDLAVTNSADSTTSSASTVSILLGSSTGTFTVKGSYPTGSNPQGIATADFNGDGHQDLAVSHTADTAGHSVSILLGNGDGSFAAPTEFAAGSGPKGIVAANFSGSATDLAVVNGSGSNVDVLIGNGDGTFSAPISLPTGTSPVAVAAADLNGDGTQDLVTANTASNNVTVTLNTLQSSSAASSAQTAYPNAEYVDLGLKIKATPRLHSNNEVTLHLEFDIKSLAGASVNGIPILSNRSVEQTVRLRENETSILSGIFQGNEARTISGLPWTSTVPGAGTLTGKNTVNDQDTELLIVITPRALRLPPHNVPALYAGHGEPSTPASASGQAPLPPTPIPGLPGQPGAQPPLPPGAAPQPGQTGQQPPQLPGGPMIQPRPQP